MVRCAAAAAAMLFWALVAPAFAQTVDAAAFADPISVHSAAISPDGTHVALAGVSLTPEAYRCAIAIAGVSDLPELVNRVAARGTATHHYWVRSIGDPGRDRALLNAVSPREQATQIRAPVLLIHGEDDDVVEIRQSELMQRALGERARLVRLPDEGHFWDEWSREHRLTVLRETESFLAQHNPAR